MGKVGEAKAVSDRMMELGCTPEEVTYRTLSDEYCKNGSVLEAFRIKDMMERQSISPFVEMYNSLINGLFKSRKSTSVADLLVEMRTRGLSPNAVTYGTLISGWCTEEKLDKAFNLYFEMIQRGFSPNSVICRKIVISLYKNNRIKEATVILDKMVDFDLLTVHQCSADLEAQRIANSLDKSAICNSLPNNIVHDIAIYGVCKFGKIDEARSVLSILSSRGFLPDNFTYGALIHACSATGDVDSTFNLRKENAGERSFSKYYYIQCIDKWVMQSRKYGLSTKTFSETFSKGLSSQFTYNILISGYCRIGDLNEVSKLREKMIEEGIS
ncbi:hypothetical protein Fmac_020859 [Flemingia macrophylla]|uniref:Pentatricopeptide repeat-containing protein n=1 Tax=Flemingia macrophylla TaxID=520843 RepID=A0ABD1LV65_9FABA